VHAASVSAGYADVADQLTVVYELPADLERLSVDDLYDQRRRAVIAGAPASSLAVIDRRITMKELADDPAELNRYIVKCRFVTFLGYSDTWVTQQSTLGYISAEDRVARTHTDIIFDELSKKELLIDYLPKRVGEAAELKRVFEEYQQNLKQ
jgi:hypothetical protein